MVKPQLEVSLNPLESPQSLNIIWYVPIGNHQIDSFGHRSTLNWVPRYQTVWQHPEWSDSVFPITFLTLHYLMLLLMPPRSRFSEKTEKKENISTTVRRREEWYPSDVHEVRIPSRYRLIMIGVWRASDIPRLCCTSAEPHSCSSSSFRSTSTYRTVPEIHQNPSRSHNQMLFLGKQGWRSECFPWMNLNPGSLTEYRTTIARVYVAIPLGKPNWISIT